MKKSMLLSGDVLYITNPSVFDHDTQTFNVLSDNSFMGMLHQFYTNKDKINRINIILPILSESVRKDLNDINEHIFDKKIKFTELEEAYGTTNFSNDQKMCEYLEKNSLDTSNIDILVSEVTFDYGYEVVYNLPYYQRINKLSVDSTKLDNKVEDLIRKYEPFFFDIDLDYNIYVDEIEKNDEINFFYFGVKCYNKELFEKICGLFSKDVSQQVKELIESIKVGKTVSLFDRDLIYYQDELEIIFDDVEYLGDVDTLVISNQTNIDDSYALSIVFESGCKPKIKDSTNLVIFDKLDDINKNRLKYQLANTKKVVTYFTDTNFNHDLELFKSMGCITKTK